MNKDVRKKAIALAPAVRIWTQSEPDDLPSAWIRARAPTDAEALMAMYDAAGQVRIAAPGASL
jgi:hypothetical protein